MDVSCVVWRVERPWHAKRRVNIHQADGHVHIMYAMERQYVHKSAVNVPVDQNIRVTVAGPGAHVDESEVDRRTIHVTLKWPTRRRRHRHRRWHRHHLRRNRSDRVLPSRVAAVRTQSQVGGDCLPRYVAVSETNFFQHLLLGSVIGLQVRLVQHVEQFIVGHIQKEFVGVLQ